jgi:hypothetical protein
MTVEGAEQVAGGTSEPFKSVTMTGRRRDS